MRASRPFHRFALPLARPLLIAAVVAALAGCFERKQSGMLNPDGSGKMTLDTYIPIPAQQPGDPAPPDAMTLAKMTAQRMVQMSQGVDAWKDLSYEKAADGRAHVVGTAYFHDLNQLLLDNPIPLTWTHDSIGNYTLSLKADNGQPGIGNAPKPTDADVAQAISQGKAEYQHDRPALQAQLAGLKVTASILLPGKVTKSNILTIGGDGDNTATLAFTGEQALGAMDKLMADDKALGDALRAGRNPDNDQDMLLTQMFGKSGGVYATIGATGAPMKPTFDYPREMQAAKAAQQAMYSRLGIDPTPPAQPPQPMPQQPGPPGAGPQPQPGPQPGR